MALMRAVVDSSSWISMARAGLLHLLGSASVEPILLDVVQSEIVVQGRQAGYADAAALATATAELHVTPTPRREAVDARVLRAAGEIGMLIANDLALGRRARALNIGWIRTADLIVLAVSKGSMSTQAGLDGLNALEASGRITVELADAYREQLR